MLERLYIKNVALIEEADIEFDGRLNILSGETGSGKSVILDSINFVLGSKADKSMIRFGRDEAFVRAEFSVVQNSHANEVLKEFDIDVDENVIISRKFNLDGKSTIKINGNTVTSAMLKKVAAHLVDVHGQSEHFFLLSEINQLSVIDAMTAEAIPYKEELKRLLEQKRQLKNRRDELGGSEQERAQKLDLLEYQINEIENADISVGELDKLISQKKLFDNYERIMQVISAVSEMLSGDSGCVDLLSTARRQMATISDVDSEYNLLYERLESLAVDAEDVAETISDLTDECVYDENEAKRVEDRLYLIKNLIKKYGTDEESVLAFLKNVKNQYEVLCDAAAELDKIAKESAEIERRIYEVCTLITLARKKSCTNFCEGVEAQLKSLNIPNAKFYVEFNKYDQTTMEVTALGADKLCFMFSANKGEPAKPLSKVISGGEMSRFMLAIKTVLKAQNGISTYIFDEIDAGISGVTALSVAEKFLTISRQTQIIAVSHLPQICASASSQFLIYKVDSSEGKTLTKIKKLSSDERVSEIVRLTGSIETEAAIQHAKELLDRYGN